MKKWANRWVLRGLLLAAAATSSAALAFTPPPFPRLGGYLINAPQNYDSPTYQAQIARLNTVILNVWPNWSGGACCTTMQQAVSAIKKLNPNEVVTLYMDMNELQQPPDAVWQPILTKLTAMNWWLYPAGSGGSSVKSSFGTNFYTTNTTLFTPRDSNGNRYVDWRANWEAQTFATPNPAVDGFFTDNVFWKPRVDGDWNLDGSVDSQNNPTVQSWWRQGMAAYINDLKTLMPGKYQFGNIGDWGDPAAVYPELAGLLQGGVMEGMIGYTWSTETWGGWQAMMNAYRKMMAAVASPQLVIFHQNGNATDYQSFRYGFASCLMDNAYYYFSNNNDYAGVHWFDEFNAALGLATTAPPKAAWQKGVYRRDFENGIALVNPKGNGAQTVTLETSFQHVSGSQASSINNGQTVTTVTLNDRDGVILMRLIPQPATQATQKKPSPPGSLTVK
jgi:hypothetical protein